MSFGVSFLTGALQQQLDNWSADDERIGKLVEGLNDKLVTADDNATEKANKLTKVANILNASYGQNGIYQLAYQVDNNAIDFNDDVNDIADRVSKFEIPEEYISSIANPYDYLGQQTQAMYENDMSAYNALYSNVNVGNKTVEMLVPPRDFSKSYSGLQEAPTIGAEPLTSAMPDVTKSDIENNAYGKMAFLVQNQIPIADGMNPKLGKFALTELEYNFLRNDIKGADSAQDIYNSILIHAAEEFGGAKFLTDTPPEEVVAGIKNILALGDFETGYGQSDMSMAQGDTNVNAFLNQTNVYSNADALSNYQKNLPRVEIDFDALSDKEANEILSNVTQGTIIEFKTGGQTYFVEF
tara:strand:+ start:193 stop:1254 length:1062 start_codon:yes stop_codon:yes gene_type:complete